MGQITTRKARREEIYWVNSKYAEIDFEASDHKNEFIIIAELNGVKCGLGRMVVIDEENLELGGIYVFDKYRGKGVAAKIVQVLCTANEFCQSTVWCLPFSNLNGFYERFGFEQHLGENKIIPLKIIEKHGWCRENYDRSVLLFSKENTK